VVQVVPQLEVWDLAVLFAAVRPESGLSSEAVRLAALVPAVVSLVSMWTSEESTIQNTFAIRQPRPRQSVLRFSPSHFLANRRGNRIMSLNSTGSPRRSAKNTLLSRDRRSLTRGHTLLILTMTCR
jgi:hypothetical protein